MSLRLILLSIVLAALCSCWPEDEPIQSLPGKQLDYTFYTHQIFYNLALDTVVSVNELNAWDLGFETGIHGNHIIMNTGKGWAAIDMGTVPFDQVIGVPANAEWKYDASSGNYDSLAINNWVDSESMPFTYSQKVFVLGLNNGVDFVPVKKAIFTFVDEQQYRLILANIDNTSSEEVIVYKNNKVNFVKIVLAEEVKEVPVEPETEKWDLLFTQYATILYDDNGQPVPYVVRGVLINPVHVAVAAIVVDNEFGYYSIDSTDLVSYQFTSRSDAIGYDWKDVVIDENANSARYTTNPNKVYIIRIADTSYYKLRFRSFYNASGQPGYIGFETIKLK